MRKLYFIAEIGQNHQGDIKIAREMVDSLVGSGVHAIKTAKRDIDICLTDEQKEQIYDNPHSFGKTYYEHRKALELSFSDFEELKNYVESKGFDFISSFTDVSSFNFLKEIGIKQIKIASQRIADKDLLIYVADNFDRTVFMSSGMSDMEDIDFMIDVLQKNNKYLMQCTSIYPCCDRDLDLRVLKTYRKRYKSLVNGFGFSGHNMSIAPDIAAFALGADVIERHYTLNRKWRGSDHKGSLEVYGLKKLIKYLKQVETALGDSKKKIFPEEKKTIKKLRADLPEAIK